MRDCEYCDGTGETEEECLDCNGGGFFDEEVEGEGEIVCEYCDGNGFNWKKCYDCNGTGHVEDEDGKA